MLFNFNANMHLWLALAREDATPLVKALEETAGIPATDQWANFLRNHDEIDLSRLSEEERADTFAAFGPEPEMQLYGRGIRRRIATMLGADRSRLELAFSLLLTLPGTPVLYYGDEIGMGEDLSLPERHPVRTAMQWTAKKNGGFSSASASDVRVPVISKGEFGYRKVNVARYTDRDRVVIALHNLASEGRRVGLRRVLDENGPLREVFGNRRYDDPLDDRHAMLELDPYGYRWLRAGDAV